MYIERIKPYEYRLLCGSLFKSQTPSTPDNDGLHNFPCTRCNVWHAYTSIEIPTLQITAASNRDMAHASRMDKAIVKDRIARDLRLEWDNKAYKRIAATHGVSDDTVFRIALELGVSDFAVVHDRVRSYK